MSKESNAYKCKKRCGHCCIICTDICLMSEEVEKKKYKTQKRHCGGKLGEWSNKVVKRKQIYSKELKKKVFACLYFDEKKSECTIYSNRPQACRWYNCKEATHGKKKLTMDGIWKDMSGGDDNYSCFEA